MDELNRREAIGNVNVTLGKEAPVSGPFAGKMFPCCICARNLEIKISKRKKPYCTCLECGIQIFFRGKVGIARLLKILSSAEFSTVNNLVAIPAIILFNKILQLRAQKKELQAKRSFVTQDPALENAIHVVDNEIERVQRELAKLVQKSNPEKTK